MIVTPIPGPKEPLPTLKQVLEVTIPANSALPVSTTVAPDPTCISPAVILIPVLAVIRPTESTFVTSS